MTPRRQAQLADVHAALRLVGDLEGDTSHETRTEHIATKIVTRRMELQREKLLLDPELRAAIDPVVDGINAEIDCAPAAS